ncbi:MAG: RlpA-like double-psi beta-barrel domain-containing protein [Hyphomicrobiaceae bacterium]|nr:RlpA-like double-psi beta-barrel domain-containing protein [Hyphomicrobiaceae bacterium]
MALAGGWSGCGHARFAHWVLVICALVFLAEPLQAKTPGKTYCFLGVCHRVKTVAETERLIGRPLRLWTSHYDSCRTDRFNPCGLTSSGEIFRASQPDNAASPNFPDGTVLLLYNSRTRRAAVVRVNNAGPYMGRRRLDVSRATADKLGFAKAGVEELHVTVLRAPVPREAGYVRKRRYRAVPGYMGEYDSLHAAHAAILDAATSESRQLLAQGSAGGARRFVETLPVTMVEPAAIGGGRIAASGPGRDVRAVLGPGAVVTARLPSLVTRTRATDRTVVEPKPDTLASVSARTPVAAATHAPMVGGPAAVRRLPAAELPAVMVAVHDYDDTNYGALLRLAALAQRKARAGLPDGGEDDRVRPPLFHRGVVAGLMDGFSGFVDYARRAARAGLPDGGRRSATLQRHQG